MLSYASLGSFRISARPQVHPAILVLLILASVAACAPKNGPRSAIESEARGGEGELEALELKKASKVAVAEVDGSKGRSVLLDDREADPSRGLPELSFRHLGMHIGGESNSPESKRPWLEDIEAGATELLGCYAYVVEPAKGGSYGVDLYVGSKGGLAEIRGSRQKLGGDDFDGCMREAFAALRFHPPERPTVLSYSLLFRLGE